MANARKRARERDYADEFCERLIAHSCGNVATYYVKYSGGQVLDLKTFVDLR